MNNTFFASDAHFGHKNILKYDKRPFKDINHHDEVLIERWNLTISKEDVVYYLGDFALCDSRKAEEIMKRLNGIKFFIKGNHDKSDTIKLYNKYGTYLGEQKKVRVEGQEIILNHYRMDVWDKSHHGAWHLFGHSHHTLVDKPNARSLDMGLNGYDYYPQSFAQVSELMSKKIWEPIDHHTGGRD